jgi:hypothetical protein
MGRKGSQPNGDLGIALMSGAGVDGIAGFAGSFFGGGVGVRPGPWRPGSGPRGGVASAVALGAAVSAVVPAADALADADALAPGDALAAVVAVALGVLVAAVVALGAALGCCAAPCASAGVGASPRPRAQKIAPTIDPTSIIPTIATTTPLLDDGRGPVVDRFAFVLFANAAVARALCGAW